MDLARAPATLPPRANIETEAQGRVWAIVLAGGDGTRLRGLTGDGAGNAVPKQFCSLDGGASLVEQTLNRAGSVVAVERITTIVSASHAGHWRSALRVVHPQNIVVQPANRGTALGVVLPALRIIERDPDARILILPSDHYVDDEPVLKSAMHTALDEIRCHPSGVALLGIEADQPDPELGYIVPGSALRGRLHDIRRFVEKPSVGEAQRLCEEGALWNSFILACRARSLVDLYLSRYRDIVEAVQAVDLGDYAGLCEVYARLPEIDFSRHIVAGLEPRLALMRVPRCGWNDLGTPQRLAQTLARHPRPAAGLPRAGGRINLAERLTRAHPTFTSQDAER